VVVAVTLIYIKVMAKCHKNLLNAVDFRQFVRPQDREKFAEVCRGVCGRDVFLKSSASSCKQTSGMSLSP